MFDDAYCWIDGDVMPASEAKISVFDHGFLYGDGIFEGIRFYHRKAFRLSSHLKRLEHSAAALRLILPLTKAALERAVEETIAASPLDEGYLRIIITRGVGRLGINPEACQQPSVIIIADQLQMVSEKKRSEGIRLVIAATRRLMPDQLDSRIKSLNYLNSILARMEANYAGVDEAILLNDRGRITEGTADNLFIVRDNALVTPPTYEGALAGITRSLILELAQNAGIQTAETPLSAYDVYTADECFLTGTGAKLIPVKEIDGRKMRFCPGGIYRQLASAYTELIFQETA